MPAFTFGPNGEVYCHEGRLASTAEIREAIQEAHADHPDEQCPVCMLVRRMADDAGSEEQDSD